MLFKTVFMKLLNVSLMVNVKNQPTRSSHILMQNNVFIINNPAPYVYYVSECGSTWNYNISGGVGGRTPSRVGVLLAQITSRGWRQNV